MGNWSEKSSNQILLEIQAMQQKHEAIKTKMIQLYDELEQIEKDFVEANKVVKERLNGTNV